MMEQRKEERKSAALFLVFAAALVSFVVSFFPGQSGILRLRQVRSDYEHQLQENHRIAMENRRLMEEIERLRQDPGAIEKIAREELHMVSPHDLVLIVPEQNRPSNPSLKQQDSAR